MNRSLLWPEILLLRMVTGGPIAGTFSVYLTVDAPVIQAMKLKDLPGYFNIVEFT